jgi:DNA/RNA-binding domain of Phe-tRNA-synthetase-like protein
MPKFLPVVSAEVAAWFPEYRALSIVVSGFVPGGPLPPLQLVTPAWCDAHIDAWHEAFRRFGSNPKRTASSVDALVRRVRKDGGLPSINPVVDCYNALSVRFAAPFGGEDIDRYDGVPRLVIADGSETFDTAKNGEAIVEHPEAGEVIWRDGAGVTCRRWNWRQCRRTAITEQSTNLWFVIDRLPPMRVEDLEAAGAALVDALRTISPHCTTAVTPLP